MFEKIKAFFKYYEEPAGPRPRKNANTFKMWEHRGWGNSIRWMNVEKGQISGHLSYPHEPYKGDILLAKMQSGKIGKFIFREIEWCGNPSDMFFSTVEFAGYHE